MVDNKYPKQWTKAAETLTELDQKVLEVAKKEVKVIEKKLMKTVEKKAVIGYKYFVTYIGPHLHLSISPGIGQVKCGVEYLVPEELYNSLKGLQGWSSCKKEVT